jgi:hypothetical protein
MTLYLPSIMAVSAMDYNGPHGSIVIEGLMCRVTIVESL